MGWSPSDSLVIGISTRALFQLDDENCLYQDEDAEAFVAYQRANETKLINPGVAFHLVKSLLDLNPTLTSERGPAVEVVIISKNHPDCTIRIKNSLAHYALPIKRVGFTGGGPILDYLRSFKVGLFLSKEEQDVREAIANGIPAGLVYGVPGEYQQKRRSRYCLRL
jgi:5'-nucleotidase